jgi:hypothetical protein
MTGEAADGARDGITAATGLPAADPIRHGPGVLLEAVRRYLNL